MLKNKIFTSSHILHKSLPPFFFSCSLLLFNWTTKRINIITIIIFRYDSFLACFALGTVQSAKMLCVNYFI